VQAGQGQTVLLPAAMQAYRLAPTQLPCTLLKAYVPDLQADVIAPLRAAGYDAAAVEQLGGSDAEHNDISELLPFAP
jgi:mannose-6-phosphate isomerase